MHLTKSNRFLAPGTRVCLDWVDDDGTEEPEFGVVIHCWLDPHEFYDCLVAFFGSSFPEAYPETPPYVLRYASVSLGVIGEAEIQ